MSSWVHTVRFSQLQYSEEYRSESLTEGGALVSHYLISKVNTSDGISFVSPKGSNSVAFESFGACADGPGAGPEGSGSLQRNSFCGGLVVDFPVPAITDDGTTWFWQESFLYKNIVEKKKRKFIFLIFLVEGNLKKALKQ